MVARYVDEKNVEKAEMNNEAYESKYFPKREEVKTITSMKEIEGW
jgi:uncharacterized protein YozE (UPF0346 family)